MQGAIAKGEVCARSTLTHFKPLGPRLNRRGKIFLTKSPTAFSAVLRRAAWKVVGPLSLDVFKTLPDEVMIDLTMCWQ